MDTSNKTTVNTGSAVAGNEGKPLDTSTSNAGNASATAADSQAKLIADLTARLDKETKEKEIYRAGLLSAKDLSKKAKRITQDELENPEKLEEAINAKIEERDLEKKAAQEIEQKSQEEARLRAENEELRRSLEASKNASGFGGTASMGAGHNESSESRPQGYWSEAQRNELRSIYNSRGMYSSQQVELMVKKAEEIAQSKTAQSARNNDMTKTRSY